MCLQCLQICPSCRRCAPSLMLSLTVHVHRNPHLLAHSPVGATIFATHQVAGRGRGKNAWISPLGCLQFSTVLLLPQSNARGVVFVQYLAALAIVESVRSGALGTDYARHIGPKLRVKWPNDVYADVGPSRSSEESRSRSGTFVHNGRNYAKLAGILVNSQFAGKDFQLVLGEFCFSHPRSSALHE